MPIATDALDRAVRAVFYDNLSCLSRLDFGEFLGCYGAVYEDYVYQTLRAKYGSLVHRAEEVVDPVEGREICDIIVDGSPFGLLLIEVKSGRLPARAEVLKLPDEIQNAFARDGSGAGKGLRQLDTTRRTIAEGRSAFPKGMSTSGLLVMYGEAAFMNTDRMRELLESAAGFDQSNGPGIGYQITNDRDTDLLVAAHENPKALARYLRLKDGSNSRREKDVGLDLDPSVSMPRAETPHAKAFEDFMATYGL